MTTAVMTHIMTFVQYYVMFDWLRLCTTVLSKNKNKIPNNSTSSKKSAVFIK